MHLPIPLPPLLPGWHTPGQGPSHLSPSPSTLDRAWPRVAMFPWEQKNCAFFLPYVTPLLLTPNSFPHLPPSVSLSLNNGLGHEWISLLFPLPAHSHPIICHFFAGKALNSATFEEAKTDGLKEPMSIEPLLYARNYARHFT